MSDIEYSVITSDAIKSFDSIWCRMLYGVPVILDLFAFSSCLLIRLVKSSINFFLRLLSCFLITKQSKDSNGMILTNLLILKNDKRALGTPSSYNNGPALSIRRYMNMF